MVTLGLAILSQRTVAVAGHLIPLFAIGSGFTLWWAVKENPSINQLVGLGLYGLFMLAILALRKK